MKVNRDKRRAMAKRLTGEQKAAFISLDPVRIAGAFEVVGGTPPLDFVINCPLCDGLMSVKAAGLKSELDATC